MKYKVLAIIVTLFVINGFRQNLFAQQSETMKKGIQFAQSNKWLEAEDAFSQAVRAEPKNGRAWFLLGVAKHTQKKFKDAIAALETSISLTNNPRAFEKVASAYAQLNEMDKAFEWLEKALKAGVRAAVIRNDPDLKDLRADANFKKFSELLVRQEKPCMYSTESRQFDFWIGDWEAFVGNRKVGENSVKLQADGCALEENWKASAGGFGKALNSYDAVNKKWKQFYVMSQGVIYEFHGEFKDNVMRMEGETIGANGAKVLNVVEHHFLADKTVRQFWKISNDGGKTWQPIWNAIFKKKTGAVK